MPSTRKTDGVQDLLKRSPSNLYRYTKLTEPHRGWVQETIINNTIYLASPSNCIEETYRSAAKNGIVCLSQSADNMLMWSYYADGHRGICLEFCTSHENLLALTQMGTGIILLEVAYCSAIPDVNFYTVDAFALTTTLFGVKSQAWQHEKEWRLVGNRYVGNIPMPIGMLSGIILGIRTTPKDKEDVRQWCQESRFRSIAFKAVHRKAGSFHLEVINVS